MPHFFISYAKKDTRDLAFTLNDALNALEGITAWVDRSLEAGRSWETEIQREIRRCDVFIVMYSPDINRHIDNPDIPESYILEEVNYAFRILKKRIIPVMAQRTDPPMGMTRLQYIDFANEKMTLDELVKRICHEAKILIQPPPPPIPPPSTRKPITPITVSAPITDILPPPFAWIDIPAGKVTLEAGGYLKKATTFDVPAFSIAKYPVTNGQFAKFMDAKGYTQDKWWTPAGWQARLEGWAWDSSAKEWKASGEPWTEPRFWRDEKWNKADYPVVGVSWYEAMAYCKWLSEVSGETIVLSGEQQWQRAAQGDDGRLYPWGPDWDCQKCNNSVKPCDSNGTTAVTQYEGRTKGDSPYGVVDMSGNVWEWCLTEYETGKTDLDGTGVRVLRGGSWYDSNANFFRTVYRLNDGVPSDGDLNFGLRIARS